MRKGFEIKTVEGQFIVDILNMVECPYGQSSQTRHHLKTTILKKFARMGYKPEKDSTFHGGIMIKLPEENLESNS